MSIPRYSRLPRFILLVLAGLTPNWAYAACPESATATLWTSPRTSAPGTPLNILAVLTDGPADEVAAIGPEGEALALDSLPRGGPPWSLEAQLAPSRPGTYRLEIRRGGATVACREITVGGTDPGPKLSGGWDTATEAFYSAWIERLFAAPPDANPSFASLEPVLRDPEHNFLYNHFGQHEDAKLPATPDCADLPYFLRTYFAWKIGLPVAYRACDRGTASRPPHCGAPKLDQRFVNGPTPAASFNGLMRQIADAVHSGSARTALNAEATDFYPVPLSRETLWPGTVYADPYGHTLMIAQWLPQTASHSGLLLAVDAQPDNSVSRKRFWEGTFLYADDVAGAGPGFKAFRPILRDAQGRLGIPGNAQLTDNAPVAPYEPELLSSEDFYARMGQLANPKGLAPEQAYEAMLDALAEQLQTRAVSVETGESYMRQHRGTVIAMPSGAAIFETLGAWEDYSTPSRDMRLLIAMKVLERLPQQILDYAQLFALGGRSPQEAKAAIEQLHAQRTKERRFSYTRSDGSPWELSVADVFARRAAFELSYNPNDCAEARWGAPPGSSEAATCTRHAPAEQRARMEGYRVWFRESRRPTR